MSNFPPDMILSICPMSVFDYPNFLSILTKSICVNVCCKIFAFISIWQIWQVWWFVDLMNSMLIKGTLKWTRPFFKWWFKKRDLIDSNISVQTELTFKLVRGDWCRVLTNKNPWCPRLWPITSQTEWHSKLLN